MSEGGTPRDNGGAVPVPDQIGSTKENANAPPNAKLLAYLSVTDELKAAEEAKLSLLLKVKDLQDELDVKMKDQKDVYFYLNKKCDDSYNMIAQLEEQLSAEQLDREVCEKGYEERIAALTLQLKNEQESSRQTISNLEDKLMSFSSFHDTKVRLDTRISELEAILSDERGAAAKTIDSLELRLTVDRDRSNKEKATALETLRQEMEHSLESRLPKAVQKTIKVNTLIREELRQQSVTAMNILDRDAVIQAESKAAKLELSLEQDNAREMQARLVSYQKSVKQLGEQLAREQADRERQADDADAAARRRDGELSKLQESLAAAETALADRRHETRRNDVWHFLASAYEAHSGPRNFDSDEAAVVVAAALVPAVSTHPQTPSAASTTAESAGATSTDYVDSPQPLPFHPRSSSDKDISAARRYYTSHSILQQFPTPPEWTAAHEKTLVYLLRSLLSRYPHRFADLLTQAGTAGIGTGGGMDAGMLSALRLDAGSFALTQKDDGLQDFFPSGGARGRQQRAGANNSRVIGSNQVESRSQSGSPGADGRGAGRSRDRSRSSRSPSPSSPGVVTRSPPTSAATRASSREAAQAMQAFRSIFLPSGFSAGGSAPVSGSGSKSDAALTLTLSQTQSRSGDGDAGSGSGSASVPDLLSPGAGSSVRRKDRAGGGYRGVFQTSGSQSVSSDRSVGGETYSSAGGSLASTSTTGGSYAVNFGLSRGSPKQRPAQLNMRGLISEKILHADPASLDSMGWKGARPGRHPQQQSQSVSLSLAGRNVAGGANSSSSSSSASASAYAPMSSAASIVSSVSGNSGSASGGVVVSSPTKSPSKQMSLQGKGQGQDKLYRQLHVGKTSPQPPPPSLQLKALAELSAADERNALPTPGTLSPASSVSMSPRDAKSTGGGYGSDLEDDGFDSLAATRTGTGEREEARGVRFELDQ